MRFSLSRIFALTAVLLCQTPNARSQMTEEEELASAFGDKSTISIATGSQQPLRRAPAVATVITAEDIAAMGASDLDQVLESVPGLHVGRNNQGYAPLYIIRGIYSEFNPQTLMLVNGVPVTTLFVGNRGLLWGGRPVENIARIEVIRGPGSALYGADAFSGVINIITKNAADIRGTEFGVGGGSFGTGDAWMQHGGTLGPFDVAAYLRLGHTDGFKKIMTADAQTGLDRAFGTSASLAPGPVNTGYDSLDTSIELGYRKWRLRASYTLRDNLGTSAGVSSAIDPVGRLKSDRFLADLSVNDGALTPNLKGSFTASYFYYTQRIPVPLQLLPPGTTLPTGTFPNGLIGAPNTWERQIRVSASALYSGFANHSVRAGLGREHLNLYRTQEFKNFTVAPSGFPAPTGGPVVEFPVEQSFLAPHKRLVTYFYVQDEWRFAKDWTFTAGLRHDKFSDFGGTNNPRLALVWDATVNLTAKLLYGSAFRAPAFTELYSINNPVIRGNPNLKPETIRTLETAFSWQARPDTHVNLSLFHYRMKDIIRNVPDGGGAITGSFNNAGAQHGNGMELEAVWDASRTLRLSGNYAYQHSIDKASGQDAGYAPRHHLFARADWRLSTGWQVSGQINYIANRKRPAGDTRPAVADFTTVDLALRTSRQQPGWGVLAAVRNLFNADVREPSLAPGSIPNDLPQAPRSVYLLFIYKM